MKKETQVHLLFLLLLTVLVASPLFHPLYPSGHSALIDLARLVEIDQVTKSGHPFSIWMPDLYFGYGSPIFRYYAPLPYYLAEVFHLIGFSLPAALKAVFLLSLLAAGWGGYFLFRELWSPLGGFVGGALYLLAPYRLVNLYVRSALGESLALGVLPWVLLALVRTVNDQKAKRWPVVAGVGTAVIVFFHNLTAFIAFPALAVIGLVLWWLGPRTKEVILRLGLVFLLGIFLSGVYWYPALAGKSEVWLEASTTTEFFDYHHHFVYPSQLVSSFGGFGDTVEGPMDEMPFPIGAFPLAVAVGSLILAAYEKSERNFSYILGTILLGGSLIMTLPVSAPLWGIIPYLSFVQFPWRFLGLAALGVAWLGGGLFPTKKSRGGLAICLMVIGMTFLSVTPWITAQYLKIEPSLLTPEGLRAAGVKTTAYHDYLPIWVRKLPTSPPAGRFGWVEGTGTISNIDDQPLHYQASIESPLGGTVECRVFWFPGWKTFWGDDPLPVRRSFPEGTILVDLPPGQEQLTVRYAGDPLRRIGGLFFLAGILLIILFLIPRRSGGAI